MSYRYPRVKALQIAARDQTAVGTNKLKTTEPLSAAEGHMVYVVCGGNSYNAYTESLVPRVSFSVRSAGGEAAQMPENYMKGTKKDLMESFHFNHYCFRRCAFDYMVWLAMLYLTNQCNKICG